MHKMFKPLTLGVVLAGLLTGGTAVAQDDAKIDFEKDIWPFVKTGCVECHRPPYEDPRRPGRVKKPKGDLVITNKEAFLKGSVDDDEVRAVIVPGKPDESSFLQRTLLPLYDDEHMPPPDSETVPAEGEWTDEQKALFKKWLEAGADFGDWTEDPEYKE